ncbi:MAG TPA: DUF2975 domain-containing protein [Sphingomicrobium sp.]|nr:DUF2975 domain-containing protein [Sphingomicrobium sp.]
MKHSAALPMAWITLRIMIILVWIFFACVVALLLFSLLDEGGTSKLLGLGGLPESMSGIRSIAVLDVLTAPINYAILKRLLDMVETVRSGDPFVRENAYRLNTIAWLLLVMGVANIIVVFLGKRISIPQHAFYFDAVGSVNGWLAVILTFVLARVFAAGAMMREDLEGTI